MIRQLMFLGAAALMLWLPTGPVHAEKAPLSVVADEWPPFSGAALPNQGMSLDIISAVLTRAGYAVDAAVVPWARIMADVEVGQFDIIGSLFADAELEAHLIYADPFYITDVQLVRPVGGTHSFTSVEALRPYAIAVGDGFLYSDTFDRADYINRIVVTTTHQAMQMVAFGRADLTLDSVDVVQHILQHEDPDLATRVEVAPGVLARQGVHMAVRRDIENSDQIVADFNATLAEMQQDGSLAALLARHVPD